LQRLPCLIAWLGLMLNVERQLSQGAYCGEATLTIFMRWDRIALLQMTLVGNDSRACAVAHFELRFKVSCNKRPA
jgi:hypothetical protein